jgi:pantothenate kinase
VGKKLIDFIFSKSQELHQQFKIIFDFKTKKKIEFFFKSCEKHPDAQNHYVLLPLKNFTKNDIRYLAKKLHIKIFRNITGSCLNDEFDLNIFDPDKIFCISVSESQNRKSFFILIKPTLDDFPWVFGKNQKKDNEKTEIAAKSLANLNPNDVYYGVEYIFDKNQKPESYIIFTNIKEGQQ